MEKKKSNIRFICGLYDGRQEYVINGVRYIAESRFLNFKDKENPSIRDRFERIIKEDLVPLPAEAKDDNMEAGYVCSAAGKEERNAAQKE